MKTKRLSVRLTEEEYEQLTELSKSYNVTKTHFIREVIRKRYPCNCNYDELKQAITDMRRIGNNMNQIAIVANSSGDIDAQAYKENVELLYSAILDLKSFISKPPVVIEINTTEGERNE